MKLLDLPGELLLRIVELLTSLERIRLLGVCRRLDVLALLREHDGKLLTLDCPSMGARYFPASRLAFLLRRAGPGVRGLDLTAPCCRSWDKYWYDVEALLAALEQPCAAGLCTLVLQTSRWQRLLLRPQQAARLGAALPHLSGGSILSLLTSASQLPAALAALRGCAVHVLLADEDGSADSVIAAGLAAAAAGAPGAMAELMSSGRLGPLCVAQVAAAARSGLRTLELTLNRSFELGDKAIGDAGAQALAIALRESATLTTLDLGGCDIRGAGAQALAGALCANATLTTLRLHCNGFGDLGVQALAGALHVNSTLTTLGLAGCSVGDTGAQALAGALIENATLTELNLQENGIGKAGARALAESLRTKNTTLMTLYLNNNDIGRAGEKALAVLKSKRSSIHIHHDPLYD